MFKIATMMTDSGVSDMLDKVRTLQSINNAFSKTLHNELETRERRNKVLKP
jgi:hypothetical protein